MDIILGIVGAGVAILVFWGFVALMERLDLFIATTRERTRRLKRPR